VRQAVLDAFPGISRGLEGYTQFPYLDVKGLVTVGVGCLIDPCSVALRLPWQWTSSKTFLNEADIQIQWERVKAAVSLDRAGGAAFEKLTQMRLSVQAVDQLVQSRMAQDEAILRMRWGTKQAPAPGFWDALSADAQLGILSMAWACGANFDFPKFEVALLVGDFARYETDDEGNQVLAPGCCAAECLISTTNNPGVIPRNVLQQQLFAAAQRVADQGLDPAVLHYLDQVQAGCSGRPEHPRSRRFPLKRRSWWLVAGVARRVVERLPTGVHFSAMQTIKIRGVERIVGSVVQPSEADQLWLKGLGFFHDFVQALMPKTHAAGALVAPATLDLVTPYASIVGTMLGNGPDPANPPAYPNGVGDCILAEDMKLAAMRAASAGSPWVPTTEQTLAAYAACTGFNASDPSTDQGTDPTAWLKWRLGGAPYPDGSKIVAAFNVDTTNWANYTLAHWLSDGIVHWASLPDGVESEEDAGDTWDVCGDPDPNMGHGFGGCGYDESTSNALEWALVPPIKLTKRFLSTYCVPSAGGGCVALIGSNMFARLTGKCAAGLDEPGLEAALAGLGSAVS
jgi:hypothetical protein